MCTLKSAITISMIRLYLLACFTLLSNRWLFFNCELLVLLCCFFFFFQAEDGIRDHCVTGVQTCALPISFREALLRDYSITQPTPKFLKAIAERANAAPMLKELLRPDRKHDLENYLWRSEERRVGKECRSGWLGNR